MKLNADILRAKLEEYYTVELYGRSPESLHLGRAEFYQEDETVFLEDHLYLATAEHLPKRADIRQNAVLVCIGDSFPLSYYRDRLCLLLIRERTDFFGVFQVLQSIFDEYDEWERALYRDLVQDRGAAQLIADSKDIFGRPLYLLDQAFRFIAAGEEMPGKSWGKSDSSLSIESISEFLSAADPMMERKNAIRLDLPGNQALCVNLFDKAGRYRGCLCADMTDAPYRGGEEKLAEFLAGFLEAAIEKSPHARSEDHISLKRVMQTLVEEQPLSRSQRVVLKSSNRTVPYLCAVLRRTSKNQQLPLSYICDGLEESFSEAHAFIRGDEIVAFLNISNKTNSFKLDFTRGMRDFCLKMRLAAGISNEFSNLFDIRIHYLQAQSALEDGLLLNPEDRLFYFSSYALTEMVINSLGGLPVEAYYPEGLRQILKHDETAGVSYLDTLRVLLEENLSYTAAAQKLYIHRSTLLDRIERIEKEMQIDLKNSEQRLQLEILLRAIDLEAIMRRG